jgi:Fe-S cluster assembly iron-binding protein IscA
MNITISEKAQKAITQQLKQKEQENLFLRILVKGMG